MAENKTKPTKVSIESLLKTVSRARQQEAQALITMMTEITGLQPVLWGPSIIGFGSMRYRHDSGREGDMPCLAFSPRKAAITVYFEGFDRYVDQLSRLGKHKSSVSCLYINKLADVDLAVLREMLQLSYQRANNPKNQIKC